jgi:hypothetical protein
MYSPTGMMIWSLLWYPVAGSNLKSPARACLWAREILFFLNRGRERDCLASIHASAFDIKHHLLRQGKHGSTVSLNEGTFITDRESFNSFPWPDPDAFDDSHLDSLAECLPGGMKLIVMGPGGILENVIQLTGYERLCFMLYDDPELVGDIFRATG